MTSSHFDTTMGGRGRIFPTTLWGSVLEAAKSQSPASREHLTRLVEMYWKPVYVYVRATWHKSVEEAKDLTQAFFAHFLEKDYIAHLHPDKGSFRGYLKEALRHFLIDANRAEQVRKPKEGMFRLDALPGELERLGPVAPGESPERAYDREWFRCLLGGAIDELKKRLVEDAKAVYFEVFRVYCLDAETDTAHSTVLAGEVPGGLTYGEVGARLGIKESDVRNYLTHCRRLLRQILKERIRDYVASDEDVERELEEVAGG